MIRYFVLLLIVLSACNKAPLSDEQRKAMSEEKKAREIKKISEGDIMAAGTKRGQEIYQAVLQAVPADSLGNGSYVESKADSLSKIYDEQIIWVTETNSASLDEKSKAIWDAYVYNAEQGESVSENMQKIGDKHLLYSQPIVKGGQLLGMWSILLLKKKVILGM
ncbi:MAG: hypothetical protein AAFX87_13110 [Bacteroidota bacterium]